MDGRLACQTDQTPDARDLYRASMGDCDDCLLMAGIRGTAAAPTEDDQTGEITSLVRAALGAGQRADPRPMARNEAGARLFARRQPSKQR